MKIQAIGNTAILKQHGKETVTSGGIVLAAKFADEPTIGDVVSVGEGRILNDGSIKPMNVQVGDTVVFRSAQRTKIDGQDYLIVGGDDLLAVLS